MDLLGNLRKIHGIILPAANPEKYALTFLHVYGTLFCKNGSGFFCRTGVTPANIRISYARIDSAFPEKMCGLLSVKCPDIDAPSLQQVSETKKKGNCYGWTKLFSWRILDHEGPEKLELMVPRMNHPPIRKFIKSQKNRLL